MDTNDSLRPTPRQCADDQATPLPPYPFRRVSGSHDPLRLCETCTHISISSIHCYWRHTHHQKFILLLKSVWSGCELCAVFLDGYLDEWCKWENVDREAARLSNLRLDSSPTAAFTITPITLGSNHPGQGFRVVGIYFQRHSIYSSRGSYFISQPYLSKECIWP
jgi:hypothetical protein